jgi:hypothetical protein
MDWIYNQLVQFTYACKNVLAVVPSTAELDLVGQLFPLRFEANIIVTDKGAYYFMISPNGAFIQKRLRGDSSMTLRAEQSTWLQIIAGRKSLTQEYNRGNVKMSNARANFMYKLVLLSVLFETKDRIVRVGRILSVFPISILRAILKTVSERMHTILNRIPSSVMQGLLNLISQLSARLKK